MKNKTSLLLIGFFLFGCSEFSEHNTPNHSLNYNPNASVLVESIEWNTSKFEENNKYILKKYTLEEKEEKNIDFNAELSFYLEDFYLPLTVSFNFNTLPDKSKLHFLISDCEEVNLDSIQGYNTSLTFNELYSNSFILEAMYDRNLSYKIKINALLRYGGW